MNSVQGKHCIFCYKCITVTAPSYLCDCIQVYNPSRILRSSSHTLRLSLRNDSALATSSTSQKASHSGRRGWSQTGDLESMITNCSGSDHDASARVVLVTTPQDLNPAPPVNGRSVGAFSQAEPGEAKDGYQSAQHHNAQRFRSRREGAGTGTSAKPAHRDERPFFEGKKFFPRKKVTAQSKTRCTSV